MIFFFPWWYINLYKTSDNYDRVNITCQEISMYILYKTTNLL